MEDLLNKIIEVSDITEDDKELFTIEFYKYIGESIKKQIKLNKEAKIIDIMFRKELNNLYNKYNIDNKSLKNEIEICMDILNDEDMKSKIKSFGLKYSMNKSKILSLVDDKDFVEKFLNMKKAYNKLNKLKKINLEYIDQITLESIYIDDEIRLDPIENITNWNISYDGKNKLPFIAKYETLKQLEKFGWSFNYYSKKVKDPFSYDDGDDIINYGIIYTIILKINK